MLKRSKKKPYPHDSDIAEAIIESIYRDPLLKPYYFAEKVRKILTEKGFYSGLVTERRIWKIYEKLVKNGRIYDYFNVISYEK